MVQESERANPGSPACPDVRVTSEASFIEPTNNQRLQEEHISYVSPYRKTVLRKPNRYQVTRHERRVLMCQYC
jgi:hypothetical protein